MQPEVLDGFCGSVGNTPLIRIPSLSEKTGCDVLGKAEFLNPGGSIKDRAALWMVNAALASGKLTAPGGLIIEATAGNTGVGLAHVCRAKGLRCQFVCPDHVSDEKVAHLKLLGAEDVVRVPRLPPSDPNNYQQLAKRMAQEMGGVNLDQYHNLDNMQAHVESTGPEIWKQTGGQVHGLVLAPGTGGTIAGCSTYLKQQDPAIQVYMLDIPGSGVVIHDHSVSEAELDAQNARYTPSIRERLASEREDVSTVMEGIGSNIIYGNLSRSQIDGLFKIPDECGVQMCHYLLKHGRLLSLL